MKRTDGAMRRDNLRESERLTPGAGGDEAVPNGR